MMRNNGETGTPFQSSSFVNPHNSPAVPSIRSALALPVNVSSAALMNSAETALASLGHSCRVTANNNSSNNDRQDDSLSFSSSSKLMPSWSLNGNSSKASAGSKASVRRNQQKTLLAQVARLQTELQMQAVRYQSTVAEFRRRLAYVSARQTHTPMAVERSVTIRIPLNGLDTNCESPSQAATAVGSAVARRLGFSVLPDGTGLGGAIVTSVVNDSIAFVTGLHVFDRICKVDGVDVCQPSVSFTQLVELLKGRSCNNRQLLTLEVARFEEPGPSKVLFSCEDNAGFLSTPSSSVSPGSKENNAPQLCQQRIPKKPTTVASVAVQTLPCLNPWFLADVRTSSTAVRTLRNGQQEKQLISDLSSNPRPLPSIPSVPSRVSTMGLPNFRAPASFGNSNSVTEPVLAKINEENAVSSASDEVRQPVGSWPSSNKIDEPTASTTMSSGKTWGTSSSSTTISLPNSNSADRKSTTGSSKKVDSFLTDDSGQPSPEKASSSSNTTDSGSFQSPVTMYTNNQHLAHTIRIQQHLFIQAQSSKQVKLDEKDEKPDLDSSQRPRSLPFVSCSSSPAMATQPSARTSQQSINHDDLLSWNDGSTNTGRGVSSADVCHQDFRWVVKVKSDGTRRIVKRPVKEAANTPSSLNTSANDYEKTSQNSTPACCEQQQQQQQRRHHHHKKHRHRRRDRGDDDKKTSIKAEHSKNDDQKRKPDNVFAVTTV